MIKLWHETAWNNYEFWQSQDKKTLRRINSLIKDIEPLQPCQSDIVFMGLCKGRKALFE